MTVPRFHFDQNLRLNVRNESTDVYVFQLASFKACIVGRNNRLPRRHKKCKSCEDVLTTTLISLV